MFDFKSNFFFGITLDTEPAPSVEDIMIEELFMVDVFLPWSLFILYLCLKVKLFNFCSSIEPINYCCMFAFESALLLCLINDLTVWSEPRSAISYYLLNSELVFISKSSTSCYLLTWRKSYELTNSSFKFSNISFSNLNVLTRSWRLVGA